MCYRLGTPQEKLLLKTPEGILKTSLAAQPGEKFLTITDLETYPIGRAFFEVAVKVGAEPILAVTKERSRHGEEPLCLVEGVGEQRCLHSAD
jgi:hypothetical protein